MGRFSYWIKIFDRLLMFQRYFPGLMKQSRSSTRRHIYLIQTYQIYFIKIYIWKRRKPESAKHRRIFMPIWFAYLTILPGSAAGAAALIYTVAPNVHISRGARLHNMATASSRWATQAFSRRRMPSPRGRASAAIDLSPHDVGRNTGCSMRETTENIWKPKLNCIKESCKENSWNIHYCFQS